MGWEQHPWPGYWRISIWGRECCANECPLKMVASLLLLEGPSFFSPNKPPLGDANRSDLGTTKVYLEGLKEMLVT